MENFINTTNEFLLDFILVRDKYLSSLIDLSSSIINDFTDQYIKLKKENKMKGILFNPLFYFNIGETLHSYLLADLLNPNSSHGQDRLFLNSFLKKIKIKEPDKGIWNITAEKGRIDILLIRDNPHSVIIIENKSNNAVDQNSQLYRYWYEKIYLQNKHIDYSKKETYKDNYKILYLPPNESKIPNESSLQKPDWEELKDFPYKKLPLEYELITFKDFICDWLKECINLIDKNEETKNNFRLKEYLNQYIELWN